MYLDVREDEEWLAGHVKGALHLKMGDILAGNYEEIPQDQPVYVYCRSGRRASEVIRFLEERGFKNLINAGGLRDLEGVEIVEGI
ncbi:MAG: rhodanese-like domain-containing protein [bacterium]|nr:rhodanese-like domain-containing protein [bacterium]